MENLINNIKNLREITGAGYLDCKKALESNNNNIDKSIEYLRIKGLSKASKKNSRAANEGSVGIFFTKEKALLIEINTETDFAAKNEIFLEFVEKIARFIIQSNIKNSTKINELMEIKIENRQISEYFTDIISKIGENIILRRFNIIDIEKNTKIFSYTHNSYKSNIGKICVALKAEIENENDKVLTFGKNLCMHIAASKPLSLNVQDLDDKLIKSEKLIQLENIKSSGKPENILNKILEGKMNKFFSEVTLYNQKYIMDNDKTVNTILDEFNSENTKFKIIDFSLFVLGN